MNLLLLPGNSQQHNKEWIDNIGQAFNDDFDEVKIQHYSHWESNESFINFKKELDVLEHSLKNFDSYCIFAKSIGVILALDAVYQRIAFPDKCIFLGSAFYTAKKLNLPLETLLNSLENIPTLFIQKENDPACSFNELDQYIKNTQMKNYKLEKLSGNDHHYDLTYDMKMGILHFVYDNYLQLP